MRTEIKKTADGSPTLYVPELDEHYHSVHGAVQESMHVFIEKGLRQLDSKAIRMLEVGFGTGLNALLTWLNAGSSKHIIYHAIEKYPLTWQQVAPMDYAAFLQLDPQAGSFLELLHTSGWGREHDLTPHFRLQKFRQSLEEFQTTNRYNLIYFDAFAPGVQPEMWEEAHFVKLNRMMLAGGILVTYCARGEVRRRMQRSGFQVERLQGPPGKREMLRAMKIE